MAKNQVDTTTQKPLIKLNDLDFVLESGHQVTVPFQVWESDALKAEVLDGKTEAEAAELTEWRKGYFVYIMNGLTGEDMKFMFNPQSIQVGIQRMIRNAGDKWLLKVKEGHTSGNPDTDVYWTLKSDPGKIFISAHRYINSRGQSSTADPDKVKAKAKSLLDKLPADVRAQLLKEMMG